MSQRKRDDSRPTLYLTADKSISNRRQISLREVKLPVFATCVPSCVAFKNPRDQLGMRNLLLQAFPTQWQVLQDTFQRLTERPFGYMVLDLHPGSSDDQRILSHLLKNEGCMRCHKFIETPW